MYEKPMLEDRPSALFDLFSKRAVSSPNAPALLCNGHQTTYAELLCTAEAMALASPRPSRPGAACAVVLADKSPATVAAILAAFKNDLAYAPLDPAYADDRIQTILEDLHPAAIFGDAAKTAKFRTMVDLPMLGQHVCRTLATDLFGDDAPIAAVLHTSGSTGRPKSVRIPPVAILAFAEWVTDEFVLSAQDRLVSHAPFAFDLSFLDLFATFNAGASLVLCSASEARSGKALGRILKEQAVTVWHSVPSALNLLADACSDEVFPRVRLVLFAGEPMGSSLADRLQTMFPSARLVNIYGCTETNDTFFFELPSSGTVPDPMPIGQPLPYVRWRLLDEHGRDAEEGELWVSCPTMMRSYGDRSETERVIRLIDGIRYYRSNDRVRRDADGLFHFHGRMDSVVKIGGTRINLLEVECCLNAYPGVAEAAVFITGEGPARRLAAVISAPEGGVTPLHLRLHAMCKLTPMAIPRRFHIQAKPLPRNANAKICRTSLPAMVLAAPIEAPASIDPTAANAERELVL